MNKYPSDALNLPVSPQDPAKVIYDSLGPAQKIFVNVVLREVSELGKAIVRGPGKVIGEEKIELLNTLTVLTLTLSSYRAYLGGEKPDAKTFAVFIVALHDILYPGNMPFRVPQPGGERNQKGN